MTRTRTLITVCFCAGMLGALCSSLVTWKAGQLGLPALLDVRMTPSLTLSWLYSRLVWGGLWGLFTGAAGLFLIPGLGPLLAAGPIVEAIVGAAAGAGVGGGVMAGAAALSHLAVAMRRAGIPEDELEAIHAAIEAGQYVVMLRVDADEVSQWRKLLESRGADPLLVFPFRSLLE